jgi:preprotein translocase subunit YajC
MPSQQGTTALLIQFLPFAMILAIFYLMVLMPMRKRQRKVQEFQASLKAGDRVVTTGGIYGTITKVTDQLVQLQIAQNVRIDIAKAAIGGLQGQEPVVADSGNV